MSNTYITVGQGPHRVLALHGWFGSAHGWGPLVDCLDRDAFTYVFMDYRGYGGSKGLRGRYTMDEIATDALALVDRLKWNTFSMIGHSMGGMAIQRVLVDAPARVRKLVAITPVPASGVPFDEHTWAFFSTAPKSAEARKAIINNTTGQRLSDYWLTRLVRHSLENSTEEASAAYLLAWARTDFSDLVKGNPVPIKIIVGENDPALNADFMRATYMRWYPNAKLETILNAGHYPMEETPAALATSIESFLAD
jgi:pimeloyl-ACP methyl ester carboxylesterase